MARLCRAPCPRGCSAEWGSSFAGLLRPAVEAGRCLEPNRGSGVQGTLAEGWLGGRLDGGIVPVAMLALGPFVGSASFETLCLALFKAFGFAFGSAFGLVSLDCRLGKPVEDGVFDTHSCCSCPGERRRGEE